MELISALDIEISSARGRRKKELTFEFEREITAADLHLLQQPANTQAQPLVRRLSQRHHGLARLLASGLSPGEAGIIMNYTASRVSILQSDPAFNELVAFYASNVDAAFEQTADQLAGFSRDVLVELQERLEEKPEDFSNGELRALLTATLDRTGLGPSSKSEQTINLNIAGTIEAARKRALEARMKALPEAKIIND